MKIECVVRGKNAKCVGLVVSGKSEFKIKFFGNLMKENFNYKIISVFFCVRQIDYRTFEPVIRGLERYMDGFRVRSDENVRFDGL